MSYICPGQPNYPTKPSYNTFWNDYLYYTNLIVPAIQTSRCFILCQWYQNGEFPLITLDSWQELKAALNL